MTARTLENAERKIERLTRAVEQLENMLPDTLGICAGCKESDRDPDEYVRPVDQLPGYFEDLGGRGCAECIESAAEGAAIQDTRSVVERLTRFAKEHGIVLITAGSVGFGRPCVGFMRGTGYVDHNPWRRGTYEQIPEMADDRLYPPRELVKDAYHKHDCLCVLARETEGSETPLYDEALRQLSVWVEYLERTGPVEVVPYDNNAAAEGVVGLLLGGGTVGYAIRFKDGARVVSDGPAAAPNNEVPS